MSMGKIEDRIKKMKEAIESEAKQRAIHIVERAEEEADIERNNIIKEEKEKIDTEFTKLHKAEKVKAKIEKSTVVNHQRIRKMTQRYRFVEQLKDELKQRLAQIIKDPSRAKKVTQDLIVQGMLRMMERNVFVESSETHLDTVQGLLQNAERHFSEIVKSETGKDTHTTLALSEYTLEQKHKNIIGGVFLRSQDGMIVCDNSLDARVDLIFEQLLPEIRRWLFPRHEGRA